MITKFPCHLNKAILFAIFLSSLLSVNVHAQIEVGTYSYNRPIGEKYWLRTTEVVGLHATHDKVFVMEQYLVDSGPDSNLYLLHILNKQGSLDRIDTLSVSGRDLDGIFNQYTFFYGSDNYMGIMGHTLSNFGIYDSMFLIIYNSQGDLVLDKRLPTSMHCTFNLDNNGVTTVLGYGHALTSGEIREYDIEGNLKTFIRGFNTGKTPGSICQINNKFYGINESGWFFSMNKDGSNHRYKMADLFRPLSDAGGMPNFDLSEDSGMVIEYRYDKFDRDTDTFNRAMCKVDTNGRVVWSFFALLNEGNFFLDYAALKNGQTALLINGLIFLDDEGKIIKKNEFTFNDDRLFNSRPQYICDDPSDTTIWTVGWAAQAIDGDTTNKTIVMHFDKNGDPIGTEQNITVTSIAPSPSKSINTNITCYPNPAKNVLYLDLSKFTLDMINITVVSVNGKVRNYNCVNGVNEIDLSDYPSGIYFLKSTINNTVHHAKFVVE